MQLQNLNKLLFLTYDLRNQLIDKIAKRKIHWFHAPPTPLLGSGFNINDTK